MTTAPPVRLEPQPHGGRINRQGRKPGVPNKVNAELKALATQYTESCVRRLAEIAEAKATGKDRFANDPLGYAYRPEHRLDAIGKLLDRAHGRPPQMVKHQGGLTSITFQIGGAPEEPVTIENDE